MIAYLVLFYFVYAVAWSARRRGHRRRAWNRYIDRRIAAFRSFN